MIEAYHHHRPSSSEWTARTHHRGLPPMIATPRLPSMSRAPGSARVQFRSIESPRGSSKGEDLQAPAERCATAPSTLHGRHMLRYHDQGQQHATISPRRHSWESAAGVAPLISSRRVSSAGQDLPMLAETWYTFERPSSQAKKNH